MRAIDKATSMETKLAKLSFERSGLWLSTSGEDLSDPMNSVKAELPVSTLRKRFPSRYKENPMSLQEQLSTLKAQTIANLPEELAAVMVDETEKLTASGIVALAPKPGDIFEDFTLPNHLGEKRSLAALRERGPVVVTFYRGGWCPYCNLELRAYQAVLPEIKAAGATLVAITPELPDASLSTSEKNELEFEVLTDANSDYSREIGLVFTLPARLRPIYETFGINVEAHNGDGQFDLPLAATFIVDVDGSIASAFVNADYTVRAEPSDVVEVLRSLVKQNA